MPLSNAATAARWREGDVGGPCRSLSPGWVGRRPSDPVPAKAGEVEGQTEWGKQDPDPEDRKARARRGSSAIQGRRCGSGEGTEAARSYQRPDPLCALSGHRDRGRDEGAAWTRAPESLRGPPRDL